MKLWKYSQALALLFCCFLVGLGLNPKVIKEVGKIAVLTGVGQVLFTTGLGFFIIKALGYPTLPSLYLAIALAFSSTIIVLKILNDKKEQNRLHGKIAIGFLLVQDIIATIALLFVTANGSGGLDANEVGLLVLKGVGLLVGLVILNKYVLPHLRTIIAGNQEFLFLFSIAWGLGIGALFKYFGFSLEVGALAAGVTLSTFTYANEIASRLKPLRDFFIFMFFIVLGSRLNLSNVLQVLPQAVGLSLFVLIGNPIIVMTIMGLLGYTKKTSFKTSLAVAQISEFSLVLLLLANNLEQVDKEVLSLGTLVALITIAVSAYMMLYDEKLYKMIEPSLSMFEKRKTRSERTPKEYYDVLIIGYKKGGQEFIKVFQQMSKRFLVIDYDPEVVDMLENSKQPVNFLYGDITDPELLEEVNTDKVRLIVSTITDITTNKLLLQLFESKGTNIVFICHAESLSDASELYEMGAAYVMIPHYIGSEKIGAFIKKSGFSKSEFRKFRDKHLAYLQTHYALGAGSDSTD